MSCWTRTTTTAPALSYRYQPDKERDSTGIHSPHHLLTQGIEITVARTLHDLHVVGSTPHRESRTLLTLLGATIDGDKEVMRTALDSQRDLRGIRQYDRADIHRVWSNSRHGKHFRTRHNDRTAIRQGIGRRARGRRYDQTISLIGGEILAVDVGPDGDHRGRVTLQDGHIIKGTVIAVEGVTVCLYLDQRTVLYRKVVTSPSPCWQP